MNVSWTPLFMLGTWLGN